MSKEPLPLSTRLMAEALGTAILVATVVGSGIMADKLAEGNQAIALLGEHDPDRRDPGGAYYYFCSDFWSTL